MTSPNQMIFNTTPKRYIGVSRDTPCFIDEKVATTHFPLEKIYIKNKKLYFLIKKLLLPVSPLINYRNTFTDLFIDGFIHKTVGKFLRRYVVNGSRILEVGVGGGKLIKYIDTKANQFYGFDIYDISPIKSEKEINIFVARAEKIPFKKNSFDIVVSTEVFEHIHNFRKAISEIYRICKPGAFLIVSIPNNFCFKYKIKGAHPEHVNNWNYYEFIKLLSSKFTLIEGRMKGFWLPIFMKSKYSIQLNYSHDKEFYNTNFFYVFKCIK
jgi:ubiquinone/menaquinone biosynthesis C-methylase UbiE